MDRKIFACLVVIGMAVLIPAPIPSIDQKHPITPESSQEALSKQQSFSGKVKIVGGVPQKVSETGMALMDNKVKNDESGAKGIGAATGRADFVGQNVIAASTARVTVETKQQNRFGLWAILVSLGGIVIWKFIQYKVDKATPVPELKQSVVDRFI